MFRIPTYFGKREAGERAVLSSQPPFFAPIPGRLVQFAKFCIVGGSGVFVDMGIFYFLADPKMAGLNAALSKICAAEIALINNFGWNELWTFRRTDERTSNHKGWGRRLLKFNTICAIGIGLAVLWLYLFHVALGWNLYVSNFLAIVLATVWNFGMNAGFNWKPANRTKHQ